MPEGFVQQRDKNRYVPKKAVNRNTYRFSIFIALLSTDL